MTTPDRVTLTDGDYNRLMDAIVSECGGDVATVALELARLGLNQPGVGRTTRHA